MKVVVADTSPINYLVLIDSIDILQRLYTRIVIPEEVFNELTADGAPPQVSAWIRTQPEWVEVRLAAATSRLSLQVGENELDAGEIAAISVALRREQQLAVDRRFNRKVSSFASRRCEHRNSGHPARWGAGGNDRFRRSS